MNHGDVKQAVDLVGHIDALMKKVHTQSLDLSFNELLDMHSEGELHISPDYQRLFQWSEAARSRFIESLLLEMPVPPIFVVEEDDGKYLLIDGLQRISSYLHLRGKLVAPHLEPPVEPGDKLTFVDCDIVKELNGKNYDDLGAALQIRLKRSFIRVEVVRKGSDARFKYWMFKRLNTGGEALSPQQIRNCSIRLLAPRFIDFIKLLTADESFKTCTEGLTRERRLTGFDEELVLRFFAFKNNRDEFKHGIDDFLTEYLEAVSDPEGGLDFAYEREQNIFLRTFELLAKSLGDVAFAFPNRKRTDFNSGFSVYHFEALTLGLQPYIDQIDPGSAEATARLGAC